MKGLSGYNTTTMNQLIGAYGNDIVNVSTGLGFGVNLTSTNDVEFENFLGSLFFQNFVDTPLSFNGTDWSRQHCGKLPLSKYIQSWNERLYLGYIKIGSTTYPSRVWHSDLPINDTIQWGYELGTNLTTKAGSNRVGSANAGFKAYNIKVGDPFFITSGSDAGEYRVEEIISDQQLNLAKYNGDSITLTTTASGVSYWVGSNYFDVERDDGDFITWLESNFNQLVIFKRESLHRYNGSVRSRVKGAPGTTSGRSVINLRDWTMYFYGAQGNETGFYAYDSTEGFKISNGIQKYIDGMDLSISQVAWKEGNLYRCYVGDIDNTDYNISIDKAVITFDYDAKAWSIDPIADVIKVATEFRSGGTKTTFIGADDAQVMQTPLGNTFNGSPINWRFDTKAIYPTGTNYNNTFTKSRVVSENASGVRVSYRRRLTPFNSDDNFTSLGDLRNEMQEFYFPEDKNRSSGVEYRFQGVSTTEPVAVIKKTSTFFRKETTVLSG